MMGRPLTILVIMGFAGSALSQCLTGDDNPATMEQDFRQVLEQSRFDFALETLKKTAQFETDNIFYSPHSLHEALTLAYFSARGQTEESLRRALHVPELYTKTHVQRFYDLENSLKKMIANMFNNQSTDYEFRTANKLWVTKERRVRECMLDLFGTQIDHVDFKADPEAIRVRVNDWASNETKGHIRDLIPVGGVTEDSDLILANAVYFKGLWKSRFDPANSKRDNFYSSGSRTSTITFMKQKGTFSHVVSDEIGAHVLELPYKGDDISMFVLLPPFAEARSSDSQMSGNAPDSVRQLIERVTGNTQGAAELREILEKGMLPKEVDISFPKFSMDKQLPVGQLLNAMGAGELLTPAADLTGLLADGEQTLHLGDAVHRAVVEVTEEGTTAAAATALFSFRSSRPAGPAVFNANHPFLYFIYDKPSRSILFAGVYRTPPPSSASSNSYV